MNIPLLIVLLFTLALITLIGHGIWALLAAIYRAFSGEPDSQSASGGDGVAARAPHGARCEGCGGALFAGENFCPVCGRARSNEMAAADLAITARQLDRFLSQGKLDSETHRLVMRLIEEERAQLTTPVLSDAMAARREVEPRPAPVEPAIREAPPALIEQKVSAIENDVGGRGIDLDEIAAATPALPAPVAEPLRQPRRSLTEMLETFMEESSVRWGELVGGLLIIGCSIALVVSLWAEIAARPLLKFSVFISVTAALFGLGFYSAHRWRLPTTSRGVLIISTLLAPLNFLAMTAFSREAVPPSLPVMGGELLVLALFFFLVYQAARVFLPESPWVVALATMGPSFAMLLARHSNAAHDGLLRAALLGVAPLICYFASCGLTLRDRGRRNEIDERGGDQLFIHLGIASFAALLPLGLFFIKPGHISHTLRQFAPLVSLFGIPAIATGIASLQGPEESQSGKTRTIATSVSLIGSLISLAALIFAWPNAIAVIVAASINCAVCLAIALAASGESLRYDLRLAHAGAIAHLTLAFLTVANLFSRNVLSWSDDGRRLAASFASRTSGVALILLFTFFAVASEWWLRRERRIESRIYGIGAVFIGAFGLLLVTAHGFGRAGDPHHAAPGYAFYALASFVIAWRREEAAASWIGSALLLAAILQSLVFKFGHALAPYHPVRLSFLVFANIAVAAAVVASVKSERARRLFAGPFTISALAASLAVAPFLIFEGWMSTGQIAARTLWLAAIWLVIAWLRRSPVMFAAFQLALASSVVFGTAALFGRRSPHSFASDLATMQAQAVALAMLSLAWIAARLALRRFGVAESTNEDREGAARFFDPGVAARLLYPGWPGVDRVLTLLLLIFLVWLSLCGAHAGMVDAPHAGRALSTGSRNLAATALGAGSWLLLLALSLVFIAGLWERFEKRAALAALILLACACLLIAGRWAGDGLTPAAYRWSSAVAFAAVSSLLAARRRLAPWLERFGWPQMEERSKGLPAALRALSLALFVAPVVIFSSLAFLKEIGGGGAAELWPARSGMIAGLIFPLLLIGGSLMAHAFRERSAAYACAAGLTVNLSVTFGYMLWASARGWGIGRADVYAAAQLNIIATSICSLVWIGGHRRLPASGSAWPGSEALLETQIGLALFLSLSALAVAGARLFLDPSAPGALAGSFGGPVGVLAVASPMLAYARIRGIKLDRLLAEHLGVGLIAIGLLSSCLASRFGAGPWAALHALGLALNASAWLLLAIRWPARSAVSADRKRPDEDIVESRDSRSKLAAAIARLGGQSSLENWAAALALATFATVLRGAVSPWEPWWTTGFSASICLLFAGLSLASRSRGYIYLAALAVNYAATRFYFWLDIESSGLLGAVRVNLSGVVAVNTIALALPAIAWLAIDLRLQRRDGARQIMPFHRVAAWLSLGLSGLTLLFQWLWLAFRITQPAGEALLDRLALASVISLLAACLRDSRSSYALRGLHIAGLIAAAMALLSFNPDDEALLVGLVAILSLYTLATSALWRGREALARFAARLRMAPNDDDPAPFSSWLNKANVALGVGAYFIASLIVLSFESLTQRLIAATASIAVPISLALLSSAPRSLRLITLSSPIGHIGLITWMSLLSAVLWGWAWAPPYGGLRAIDRAAVVMVVVGAALIAYRFIVSRILADDDARRRGVKAQLPIAGAAGLAGLIAILSAEASNYVLLGDARAPWWVVIAVFAALVSLFCACIEFALAPGRDPFNLSERGRMNYVYCAEALVALSILHARLTMPWLFGGFFLTWWPLVVMLLAFTGVGLGELFRRRGKLILAGPLERTGILLPLLPVFGFWVVNSQVSYSGLLFLVGLFYGMLSVIRRSFAFGILAASAGNGGLWSLLSGVEGYGFRQHPQLWLIPVALSVLVAGHVNRERLTKDQMTMIRYSTLMMIYVSSTSDIFINGVSESPWLTMVLAVLSVMGALAGVMLRIRAFLFLGAAFLSLSVLAMIWTASVTLGWDWLWYVTGIALGALIFLAFALFEKRRREMLEMVERLKRWQA